MKTLPFDITKAKTPSNPNGRDVVTGAGEKVRILCTDINADTPIVAAVTLRKSLLRSYDEHEVVRTYTKYGVYQNSLHTNDNLALVAWPPRHMMVWGFVYEDEPDIWKAWEPTFHTEDSATRAANDFNKKWNKEVKVIKFHEFDKEDK